MEIMSLVIWMIFKKINYHFFRLLEEILMIIFVTNEMSDKAPHLGNFMNFCPNFKKLLNFLKNCLHSDGGIHKSPSPPTGGDFGSLPTHAFTRRYDHKWRVLGGIKRDFCKCLWIIQFKIYLNAVTLLLGRTSAKDWIHVLSRFKSSFFET